VQHLLISSCAQMLREHEGTLGFGSTTLSDAEFMQIAGMVARSTTVTELQLVNRPQEHFAASEFGLIKTTSPASVHALVAALQVNTSLSVLSLLGKGLNQRVRSALFFMN
jgi:hypothetical protein